MMTSILARSSIQLVKKTAHAPALRSLSLAVRYAKNGQPADVYKVENIETPSGKLGENEVAVRFLAAPINPSDINLAEGTYGKKPSLPAVGGNEGVGVVTEVGAAVRRLQVGDWVLPSLAPFGTWRQEARASEGSWLKVRNDIPAPYAATMAVNMGTALRLLEDFAALRPGDWIIQNGANSMVGLAVLQMARERGVNTVNVIRGDRPDAGETLRLLSSLGGDINIPDTYLPSFAFQQVLRDLPGLKLGLNCIGGQGATDLARALSPNAPLVTYGGMSKQPLSLPFDLVAQKQLQLKGFWISHWFEQTSIEEREEMFAQIGAMIKERKLTFFYELHDLDDFPHALEKATEPFKLRKVVLNVNFPDRLKEHDALSPKEYEKFNYTQYL